MSQQDSTVSIVIPCYNNALYVAEAIESALGQSHPHIEVIVVDDGSTDDSRDVIEAYRGDIKIIAQDNRGACVARNRGLDQAEGAYVKFLDGDDILLADCIEQQMRHSSVLDGKTALYGDFSVLYPDGRCERPVSRAELGGLQAGDKADFRNILNFGPMTATPLYPTTFVRAQGGFNPAARRGQEHELAVRLFLNGLHFVYMPDHCYIYRQHEGGGRISAANRKDSYYHDIDNFRALVELAKHGARAADWPGNCRVLALSAWGLGRRRLRYGERQRASGFFELARDLGIGRRVNGSPIYRLLNSIFGPFAAERMGALVERLGKARLRDQSYK